MIFSAVQGVERKQALLDSAPMPSGPSRANQELEPTGKCAMRLVKNRKSGRAIIVGPNYKLLGRLRRNLSQELRDPDKLPELGSGILHAESVLFHFFIQGGNIDIQYISSHGLIVFSFGQRLH